MKRVLLSATMLILIMSVAVNDSAAQKTELRGNVYSGLFFFRGSAATATSSVNIDDVIGYFNPRSYGKRTDFSHALEIQLQRVTRNNHVVGIGVGYETLRSKADIDSLYGGWSGPQLIDGKVTLQNKYLTVNPYIGQRFRLGKVEVDLLAGVDFAFSINVTEIASITSPYEQKHRLVKENHPIDYRPRIQLNTYIDRLSILAGYSMGLENLYFYDNPFFRYKKAYANFLRLGVGYRL